MKNPFNGKVFVISPGAANRYHLAHKVTPDGIRTTSMTKEQSIYAAHAINAHEKLVAMLDRAHASLFSNTHGLRDYALIRKINTLLAEEALAEATGGK